MSIQREKERITRINNYKTESKANFKKRLLPKFILLIVIAVMIIGLCLVSNLLLKKEKFDYKNIAIITDIHVVANKLFNADNYNKYRYGNKMLHISEATLKTFSDEIIKQKADFLFVCGDLTEYGDIASHEAVAKCFSRIERHGVDVFVINGNHDIRTYDGDDSITREEFRQIYYEYGYSSEIAHYDGTLSYVADIDNEHRIIAIDNIEYRTDGENYKKSLSDEHRLWLYDQLDKCIDEGKIPLVIAHKPLMTHFPEVSEILDNFSDEKAFSELVKHFALNGAEISFVGHEHINDIKTQKFISKNVEYRFNEVETSCFNFGTPTYRLFKTNGDDFEITTRELDRLNFEYVSPLTPPEVLSEIKNNGLITYGNNVMNRVIKETFDNIVGENGILNINLPSEYAELNAVYDILYNDVLKKFVEMPFYIKDENSNVSLQRIVEGYGKTLPVTDYTNILDLIQKYIAEYVNGNENYTSEFSLFIQYVVYGLIWNIDEAKSAINNELNKLESDEIIPDIDIDIEKLFNSGELECYDSNLIPCVVYLVEKYLLSNAEGILGSISIDFLKSGLGDPNSGIGIHNNLILSLLNSFTKDKFNGIDEYIYNRYIKLGGTDGLIIDGLFNRFASDITIDTAPNDREFKSEYRYKQEK